MHGLLAEGVWGPSTAHVMSVMPSSTGPTPYLLPGAGSCQDVGKDSYAPLPRGLLSQQESPMLGGQGQRGEAALFPEGTPKERKGEVPLWQRGVRTEIILELCQSVSR